MPPFTADYLTNLAAELTAELLPALSRRLQAALVGDEATQAMERSLHTGIVALLTQASATSPEQEALLADIFSDFLQQEGVAREIALLLRGQEWDLAELALLFAEAGYEAGALPGLDFAQGMNAFAAAFLVAIAGEPALQGALQTHQLLAQTHLQQALLTQMERLVERLQNAGQVGIHAGEIRATNVVSGTQIIYQWPGGPSEPDTLWEAHYLRTLLTHCDALDLAAVDETYLPEDGAAGLRLSDVFTPLYLERDGQLLTRRPGETVAEALRRRPQAAEEMTRRGREKEEEQKPIPAVAVVAALPRLVILGYPGGGKSTLVNYLAAQLATRRLGQPAAPDALPGWPDEARPLPVRIVLRRFAASLPERVSAEERAGLVWAYIEQQLAQWGSAESFAALKRTLVEEGGVILFDGLDEVRETDADTRRSLIKEAIATFAAPLTKCKVVVTCRDYAYKRGDEWRLPETTFPVFALPLFGREQMDHFTRTWYRKIGPLKGWAAERSQEEAKKLFTAVQMYAHLQELAQYPLLLTLMAQVHGRDGFLPEDRADLYERAVKLLLAHWENRIVRDVEGGRQVEEPGLVIQLGVRLSTLRYALARVAFAAHERQEQEATRSERTADIHRLDVQDELAKELGSLDKAETVIRYIQQRAGLLQARDRYTYTFPHRTFQEYLAAAHIWQQSESDPVTMLKERVERDPVWWREVFLLAAGIQKETPTTVVTLVSELLYKEPPVTEIMPLPAAITLLAGQALQDTGFARRITPGVENRLTVIYQRTQEWLLAVMRSDGSLPARERAAAGRILAHLGDPRDGVGVDPTTGRPDIVWGKEVPAGAYTIGDDASRYSDEKSRVVTIKRPYRLARYPITNFQFQCFVNAADRDDPRWWDGLPADEQTFSDPAFPLANYPRETVSWYQAIAFARWLNHKLRPTLREGEEIDLPHEYEWEVAARYPDGRFYPWGNDFDAEKANTGEGGIGSTTAVGIYPAGRNPALDLFDLSGNVWEWCRNKYDKPEDDRVDDSGARRVVRGGSWAYYADSARAASRGHSHPDSRPVDLGFRVVARRPPSHDH